MRSTAPELGARDDGYRPGAHHRGRAGAVQGARYRAELELSAGAA
ncbi:hypothetical protein [Stigmatella aurantiaca]|uniref:Uncharacterized protein n=1 Tax=Stigmatella aurantiaca (strain DW4/3-1) TaxID=378806 RepID=Q09DW5_STIAD|nr:hypothetical protein [Stigmatella aurantiaca]EAU69972.1 hypothetical protein STIAU_5560 [Stigmatella aurantiaca DW4/3-1]